MTKIPLQLEIPKGIARNKRLKELLLKAASDFLKEMGTLRLYEEGVISLSEGAELLELSPADFIILLGKRGIPYFLTKEEWEQHQQQKLEALQHDIAKGSQQLKSGEFTTYTSTKRLLKDIKKRGRTRIAAERRRRT